MEHGRELLSREKEDVFLVRIGILTGVIFVPRRHYSGHGTLYGSYLAKNDFRRPYASKPRVVKRSELRNSLTTACAPGRAEDE
jgi:hypothetical protein